MIKKQASIFLIFLIAGIVIQAKAQYNYPVPVKTDKLLFFFQRSHNKNTVVYELNTLPDGNIKTNEPVTISWIRYEEGGIKKQLSLIQRKVFGLQWQLTDEINKNYVLRFNSFNKREIYLLKVNESNNYKAYIRINGELAELTMMYMKSENNSFGIPLAVKYIDISGINLLTGKNDIERYVIDPR
jgi:hypothetical protein